MASCYCQRIRLLSKPICAAQSLRKTVSIGLKKREKLFTYLLAIQILLLLFILFSVDLLGLLNWSSNRKTLKSSLRALLNVIDSEVVKFLQDILDALFDILRESSTEEGLPESHVNAIDKAVFACLLRLIEIVFVSDMYRHFQSVLDVYINESFSATLAYRKLINVLKQEIEINMREEHDESLYRTVKNLPYVIKFIIRSRILHENLDDNKDREEFQASLSNLLAAFVRLTGTEISLLRSQGAVVKYLPIVAVDLMQVYSPILLW